MEHPLVDGQVGEAQPEVSDSAHDSLPREEATGKSDSSRRAVLKPRPRTMYDLKAGPPGSRTSEKAVADIRRAIQEAIGQGAPDLEDPTLRSVLFKRARSLFATMPDDPRPPQYSVRSPKEGNKFAEVPHVHPPTFLDGQEEVRRGLIERPDNQSGNESGSSDELYVIGSREDAEPKPIHADMLFSVIPRRWYQHVRIEKGRGAARSKRVYFEAIHILAYIVFMYRDASRFEGELLHMNQKSICIMLGITSDDYLRAIRYLEREGYITRVVVRGLVPWDPRAVGVYTFAIPRLAKLRSVTVYGKRASAKQE